MASFKLQTQGIEELKKRLVQKRENLYRELQMRLTYLAEDALNHAKEHKGYHDRTANLKNSISYALFKDGNIVDVFTGTIPEPKEVIGGQGSVSNALNDFCNGEGIVREQGFTLVIVAGMRYGVHVENKGYNVLYLTKDYIQKEIVNIAQETIRNVLK